MHLPHTLGICTGVCRHVCDQVYSAALPLCVTASMLWLQSSAAVLKSRPRLIDLHYFIVQRLPPVRSYANAVCFTLGLNMEFAGGTDDKFQVTTALRRWLECHPDSSIPRTWGALLVALRKDFRYDEIPATWVDDITKDLVRKYTHSDCIYLSYNECDSVGLCVSMLDLCSACVCVATVMC